MTITKPPLTETFMTIDNAFRLATQLQEEGQLAKAEEILNRILQSNPTHAYALHLLGVIAYQSGDITLAISLIQKALNSDASVELFHRNLGEMYRQLKMLDLSIECGQRAVKLNPYSAVALSNLGVAYYDAKNHRESEICHQRALALNPQQSHSLNNMGSLCKERQDIEEAKRYYKSAIAVSPGYVEPLNNLGAVFIAEQQFSQAIEILKRAIACAPTFADAYCNLGFAYHGLDDEALAFYYFQQALQLRPHYAEVYIGLSKVYNTQSDFEAAERYALKAIELDPSKAEFYQCLAEVYSEKGDAEQAMAYFDRALSIDPGSASAHLSKGNLLIELGEATEAESLLSYAATDRSLATQLSAHCSLIQLHTMTPDDKSMQALLSIAEKHHDLPPNQQEYLHFSLGKCYEDIGEWSTAFEQFSLGCQLKRRRIHYSHEEQQQFVLRIIQTLTKDTIDNLRASANASTLPIFVLGMPRSGTSLIEQIIASHPMVYGAGEMTYLNKMAQHKAESHPNAACYPENIRYLTPAECRTMADKYIYSLQGHAPKATHITDKMPGNFMLIGLIHALLPHAKIIHVERNPIDTCLSCYTKLFRNGQFFSYDLTELAHYYAHYRRIMAHWRSVLPANAWLDVRYEHVVSNLELEARQLIDYCGLEWDASCLDFYTIKRQVRTASLTQVRKPIYTSSIERWRHLERELAPLIKVLREEACL